ncbi:hypothetical protein B0H10DRAFT_2440650 [Mycena sp. CBHHK59/15]|nr:hypothetical protein B0H10DRAFT_2440650 [Mycena sp. CBHHK59/15]
MSVVLPVFFFAFLILFIHHGLFFSNTMLTCVPCTCLCTCLSCLKLWCFSLAISARLGLLQVRSASRRAPQSAQRDSSIKRTLTRVMDFDDIMPVWVTWEIQRTDVSPKVLPHFFPLDSEHTLIDAQMRDRQLGSGRYFLSLCYTPSGFILASMKRIGGRKLERPSQAVPSTSRPATSVPTVRVTFHTDATAKSEERYVANAGLPPLIACDDPMPDAPPMPFYDTTEEDPGAIPAYETTTPSEKTAKIRQNVAHMNELRAEEATLIQILLALHYSSHVLTPCSCGIESHLRKVACRECLQAELLCRQCWVNKHRTMPTHWVFVWNKQEHFFEKHNFCRVMTNTAIGLGHYKEHCPESDPSHSFTLVDANSIHATAISFCRCPTADGKCSDAEFKQLLRAGIFPGSIKEPKTGYMLGLLDYYRQQCSQGKGSAYNFVHVLRCMADPIFAGSVPDIYANFLAITRFYEYLGIIIQTGHTHEVDVPLPSKADQRGVNMPLLVKCRSYLRHLISTNKTLDGNYKQNLFFKRDNGSDTALTDGKMHFPLQAEYEDIVKTHVVTKEDTSTNKEGGPV